MITFIFFFFLFSLIPVSCYNQPLGYEKYHVVELRYDPIIFHHFLSVETYRTQIVREYNMRMKQDFIFLYHEYPFYDYTQIIELEGPDYSSDLLPDSYPHYHQASYFDNHKYENTWVENDSHEESPSTDNPLIELNFDMNVNINGNIRILDVVTLAYFLDKYSKFQEQIIIVMNLETGNPEIHFVKYDLRVIN